MDDNWLEKTSRAIGDGYSDIEAASRRLEEATAAVEALPPVDDLGDQELSAQLLGVDGFDLAAGARASVQRDADREARRRHAGVLNVARSHLGYMHQQWTRMHEGDLCAELHEERLRIREALRPLIERLAPIGDPSDLGHYPNLARAFAVVSEHVEDWRRTAHLHRDITGIRPRTGDWETSHGTWPQLEIIAEYMSAWPQFWQFTSAVRESDGTPVGDVPPPWQTDTALDLARVITRFNVWTPTERQYTEATEHLTREAIRLRLIANREYNARAKTGFQGDPKPAREYSITALTPPPVPSHLGERVRPPAEG